GGRGRLARPDGLLVANGGRIGLARAGGRDAAIGAIRVRSARNVGAVRVRAVLKSGAATTSRGEDGHPCELFHVVGTPVLRAVGTLQCTVPITTSSRLFFRFEPPTE